MITSNIHYCLLVSKIKFLLLYEYYTDGKLKARLEDQRQSCKRLARYRFMQQLWRNERLYPADDTRIHAKQNDISRSGMCP